MRCGLERRTTHFPGTRTCSTTERRQHAVTAPDGPSLSPHILEISTHLFHRRRKRGSKGTLPHTARFTRAEQRNRGEFVFSFPVASLPSMADPTEETVAAPPPTPAAPAEGGLDTPLSVEPTKEADASPEKAAPPAPAPAPAPDTTVRSRGFKLLGEDTSVHKVLGGGKAADVLLWKDKKTTAVVIGGATVIWVLFEVLDYHLLTLLSHVMIGVLAVLFLWSKAITFIKKSPPDFPVIQVSEDAVVNVARALRNDVNRSLHLFREIAMGHDLKKFLGVIAALWVLSEVGSCCDFLTLIYVAVLMIHTVPILYDKYQDKVDHFAGKAHTEACKHYEVLDTKVLSKIPRGPAKDKKQT